MKKIINEKYRVTSKKLPESFDGFRIVMLSDLHDNVYGISLDELYKMVDRQTPDLVVVAGDLLTRKSSNGSDEVVSMLARLADKYFVCFASGNHETKVKLCSRKYGDRYNRLISDLMHAGVRILNNKHLDIKKNGELLHIYGLEISLDYVKKINRPVMADDYVEGLIGKPLPGYGILIAHNPMFFEQYARWGADLTLSGHMHGGIIRLPKLGGLLSPDYRLFPKYDGGLFEIGDSVMILGRGLGTHTINVRINNPPELVTVELYRG